MAVAAYVPLGLRSFCWGIPARMTRARTGRCSRIGADGRDQRTSRSRSNSEDAEHSFVPCPSEHFGQARVILGREQTYLPGSSGNSQIEKRQRAATPNTLIRNIHRNLRET